MVFKVMISLVANFLRRQITKRIMKLATGLMVNIEKPILIIPIKVSGMIPDNLESKVNDIINKYIESKLGNKLDIQVDFK